MTDTLKTVQALVDALGRSQLPEDSGLWDSHLAAIAAGNALIAQMQRDAVQPFAWAIPYKDVNEPTEPVQYVLDQDKELGLERLRCHGSEWVGEPIPLVAHHPGARACEPCGTVDCPEHGTPVPAYTWPPKACPCGSNQRTACQELGCEWERDPSLVPMNLRSAAPERLPSGNEEKPRRKLKPMPVGWTRDALRRAGFKEDDYE